VTSEDWLKGNSVGAASPWFARVASGLLEAGATKEALNVCLEGTRVFPRYATGRLMLGKCYEALGWHIEAMLEYRRVIEAFPDNRVVQELVRGVEERERKDFGAFSSECLARLQGTKDRMTFEEYIGTGANVSWPLIQSGDSKIESNKTPPAVIEEKPTQVEENQAAEVQAESQEPDEVKQDERPQASPETTPEVRPPDQGKTSGRIVTATLAEIYASQGEYDEAIEAYRALIQQRPGSAGRYRHRLEELEELRQLHRPGADDKEAPPSG
jgi:tetratricopeptide (TPR) repeat protein